MNLYAFELGRKKELCFAELLAILGKDKLQERNLDTAIFKLDQLSPSEAQELQDRLGGTIKIIQIVDKFSAQNIEKLLNDNFEGKSGKIVFAVSTLSFKNPRDINIKEILKNSKIFFKKLNLNSRFVNQNNRPVKPSTIFKAKVVEKGIDLCIIKGEKERLLGKTVAIQNINAYSKRDYKKPHRDAHVGMTPPKLAQTMINLAGKTNTIYDPFCGTGTYLMEAMLMGKKVIGSDLEERMVNFAEGNCDWLQKTFKNNSPYRIFQRDARFVSEHQIPEKLDAVVTEGYLGEPVSRLPSPEQREKTFRELANLHLNWLNAVHPLLKSGAKVVMCVAAFKDGKRIEHLPKFDQLAQTAGYRIVENFTYDRPDQIVARDIKVLQKKD